MGRAEGSGNWTGLPFVTHAFTLSLVVETISAQRLSSKCKN